MTLRPLADRVVVDRDEAEEKSPGGIVIPDAARKRPQRGTVVAVGPGKFTDAGHRMTPELSVGDRVLFGFYSGEEVKLEGGEKRWLMREGDILAIIEGE